MIQSPRPDAKVGDWLRELQNYNLALREHEHVPLYEIQRWAGHPGQALFDSIIVFENYPVDKALNQRSSVELRFGEIVNLELTNYAMTLSVQAGDQLAIEYSYLRQNFDPEQIEVLQAHVLHLLDVLVVDAGRSIADLELLTEDERTQILDVLEPRRGCSRRHILPA